MTILARVALFLRAVRPRPRRDVGLSLRFIREYDVARDIWPATPSRPPVGVLWKDGHWNVIEGEEF